MSTVALSERARRAALSMQQNELDESELYARIARRAKGDGNRETLARVGEDERSHYELWKSYTGVTLAPRRFLLLWRLLLFALLGFTFTVKRMEKGEQGAQTAYQALIDEAPETRDIIRQEEAHEAALLAMLDEERLRYVGSMVLGLSDALVELTGTLAGLTFALQNTRLVALSGLITGVSATLSMASSEFLSARSEGRSDALKSCLYTGAMYLVTVALLALPYLLFPAEGYVAALAVMLCAVVAIIAFFNYYVCVAKDLPFRKRFFEMAGISLGVALLAFGVGLVVKNVLGIDV